MIYAKLPCIVRYHDIVHTQWAVLMSVSIHIVTRFPCIVIVAANKRTKLLDIVLYIVRRFHIGSQRRAANQQLAASFENTIHLILVVILQHNSIPHTLPIPRRDSTCHGTFGCTWEWLHCNFIHRRSAGLPVEQGSIPYTDVVAMTGLPKLMRPFVWWEWRHTKLPLRPG